MESRNKTTDNSYDQQADYKGLYLDAVDALTNIANSAVSVLGNLEEKFLSQTETSGSSEG